MPAPLAIPLVGKLGLALKGLMGAGKAAGATQLTIPGLTAAGKGAGIAANIKAAGIGADREAAKLGGGNGVSFGGIKRFAGQALNDYMGPGGVTPGNIAMNFGPDLLFGGLAGAMTPGDLGDKLIAGTTTAVGGAMGGVGAVGMLGKHKNNPALRLMGEMGGGIAGDMVGQSVGDSILRVKGGGMTPYEREAMLADAEYRRQIEAELISQGLA